MIHDKNKAVAFICGDLVAMFGQIMGNIWSDAGHFSLKVLATIIVGACGGVAGVIGKDLYQHLKENYKKKKKLK